MKGLIALRPICRRLPTQESARYQERVHLVSGQNGVEKDVVIGYQITAPNGDVYAVFVNADNNKSSWFTLGAAFAHLRKV